MKTHFFIIVIGVVIALFVFALKNPGNTSGSASASNAETKPARNTAERIAWAKAELDAVKASRSKDGKPGKLSMFDLRKPEIVLPVALALVDNEFEELGINRISLTKEIKEHPEDFGGFVPEHWRPRFLILTPALEKSLDEQTTKEILSENPLLNDKKAQERVNNIAAKIIEQLPRKPELKLFIIRENTFNACCLANGTVFVHSALLKEVQNDDELAFVLAHEYAHFVARHTNEKITNSIFATAGDVLAEDKENKLFEDGKKWRALFLRFGYDAGNIVGFRLPYSRRMETEADTLGLRYMTRAGYNPLAAVALWKRISDTKESSLWKKYLSTHPDDPKRIVDMQKECNKLLNKEEKDTAANKISRWLERFSKDTESQDNKKPQ